MEAEMFSRVNMLLIEGKVEEANRIACWLYAYWKLKGVELWRGVFQTRCFDKEIENLLINHDIEKTIKLMEVAFSDNPNIEMFAKLILAEVLLNRKIWIDEKALNKLVKEIGMDEFGLLGGEISLTNSKIGVEKPWLILSLNPKYREVVRKWLEKIVL